MAETDGLTGMSRQMEVAAGMGEDERKACRKVPAVRILTRYDLSAGERNALLKSQALSE